MANLSWVKSRTAYQSFEKTVPGSSGRFVRMLKKRFHLAVLEHAFASFSLVTSRAIANEIIRHRHTSMTQEGEPTGQAEAMTPGYALTQESTRWIRYEDGLTVIDNPRISEGEYGNEKHRVWADAMYYAEASYKRLLELGARPEDARDVLPLATKTEIVITTNFSQWLHIIRLRCAPDAHHMARELIGKIWERLKEAAPNVFWE
jgi:thymidylate synthase (FAD)